MLDITPVSGIGGEGVKKVAYVIWGGGGVSCLKFKYGDAART